MYSVQGGLLRTHIKKLKIGNEARKFRTKTGWSIPKNSVVHDVFLNVINPVPEETLSVGTSKYSKGYIKDASIGEKGIVKPTLEYENETLGKLLKVYNGEDDTRPIKEPDVTSSGDTIVYSASSKLEDENFEAEIIIVFTKL